MPSQARTSRLGGAPRRRAAAGASGLAAVEVDAVRRHWSSLSVDEKIAVLHFQDRALVEKLHAIQQMLRYSELMCYVCGVSTRDAVRKNVPYGLDSFEFECQEGVSGGGMGLRGFKATRKFAESEDMLDHMEQQLGGFLAEGSRTPLWQTPSDWVQLFDPSPNSWSEFLSQVLRLVELALFRAYRLAGSSGDRAPDQTTSGIPKALLSLTSESACELEAEQAQAPVASAGSRSSKRKARKRRMESKQPGREEEEEEDDASIRVVDVAQAEEADEAAASGAGAAVQQQSLEMEVTKIEGTDSVEEVVDPTNIAGSEGEIGKRDEYVESAVQSTESHFSTEDADCWQVVSRRRGRAANVATGAAQSEVVLSASKITDETPALLESCSQSQVIASALDSAGHSMQMLRGRDKQATPPLSGSRASSVTATTADDAASAPGSPSLQSSTSDGAVAKRKDGAGSAASSMQWSTLSSGSSEELRLLDGVSRRAHTTGKVDDLPCLFRPLSSPQALRKHRDILVPRNGRWQADKPLTPRSTDVIVRAPHEHSSTGWSAWVNNGSVGADCAWQLVTLEPSAATTDFGASDSPVPVQVVATELRVEVRRTFLEINPHETAKGKARDRARSAGP